MVGVGETVGVKVEVGSAIGVAVVAACGSVVSCSTGFGAIATAVVTPSAFGGAEGPGLVAHAESNAATPSAMIGKTILLRIDISVETRFRDLIERARV